MKPNFSLNLNTKELIEKIVNLNFTKDDLIKLSKNFVYFSYSLINFDKDDSDFKILKYRGDCYYDKDTNTLKASKCGFVHYTYYDIKILPPFFISKDNLYLFLYIPKFLNKVDLNSIVKEIENLDISNFQKEKIIEINKPGFFVIAKGKKPIHGVTEQIYPIVEEKLLPGKIDEKGNINFFEKNFICNVKKDQLVAKIVPETKPVDGYDIFGKTIPAKYFDKKIFKIGEGIRKRGNRYYSAIEGGIFTSKKNILRVLKLYKIVGDLSLKTGNIHANGTLIVTGNIEEGIQIDVKGDLYVFGGIYQPASINVDGNLVCLKGFTGIKNKFYNIEGDFYAEFILNANLKVKGSIIVQREISNSEIYCCENIFCYKNEGTILSSKIYVNNMVLANYFGKKHGGKNLIYLGYSNKVIEILNKIEELRNQLLKSNKDTTKIKKSLLELEKRKLEIIEKKINYKSNLIALKTLYEDNKICNLKTNIKLKEIIENSIVYFEKDWKLRNESLYTTFRKHILSIGNRYYEIKNFKNRLDFDKIESKSVADLLSKKSN